MLRRHTGESILLQKAGLGPCEGLQAQQRKKSFWKIRGGDAWKGALPQVRLQGEPTLRCLRRSCPEHACWALAERPGRHTAHLYTPLASVLLGAPLYRL